MFAVVALLSLLSIQDIEKDHCQLYSIAEGQIEYAGTYRSIQDVDFKNINVHIMRSCAHEMHRYKLRNGKAVHRDRDTMGEDTIWIESVNYVSTSLERTQTAVVVFRYVGIAGSSCGSEFIQVFHLLNGKLSVVQQIDYGNRGRPTTQFDWKRGLLRLTAIHPCDSNAWYWKLEMSFRWTGSKFQQLSIKEVPTLNGEW